jgi:hypothetical protein
MSSEKAAEYTSGAWSRKVSARQPTTGLSPTLKHMLLIFLFAVGRGCRPKKDVERNSMEVL